jgi:membrane fusion protein, multidrug efflux system
MKTYAKRGLIALLLVVSVAGVAWAGHGYWTQWRFLQATDDAYIEADYTIVAPKVQGYIAEVRVSDNEPVKAGQVLARIDDRDFRIALAQATADVATAAADIRGIEAQLDQQRAAIDQAAAAVALDRAALTFAQQDAARYDNLMRSGVGTVQQQQERQAALREREAALQRDDAARVIAEQQVHVLQSTRDKAETALQHFEAIQQQATLNLSYTTITSAIDGSIGARSLRVGEFVQAGTQLMAVVPLRAVYVLANFKETQLTAMRAGQGVTIAVDSFPGRLIHGRVDSLSPASGLEFSLLPPDNATGNFTKIVQRIPVKIVIDQSPLAGLLRPGMSVEATVDTRGRSVAAAGARLAGAD